MLITHDLHQNKILADRMLVQTMENSHSSLYLQKFGSLFTRDVPDPDTGIRYLVKSRHPALSGIRYKFAGYLPYSTVRYFVTTMKRKSLLGVYKL
jgi:hypothetical protein